MQTVHTAKELREIIKQKKREGLRIGLVPTMGSLHEGHLTLVREAQKVSDFVVSTIFVNPTQFCAGEDFDSYPRTLKADAEKLESVNCHLLFAPKASEVYPDNSEDWVTISVKDVTQKHCGSRRPGHFEGVALVVTKLFNFVTPDVALFGKKDFQQLAVIRRLTQALSFGIEIIGVETVREESGLAKSSRNAYLSDLEIIKASNIYSILCKVKQKIVNGRKDYEQIAEKAQEDLISEGFMPEYFNICNADTLKLATAEDTNIAILTAAKLGDTRLIDNIDFQIGR